MNLTGLLGLALALGLWQTVGTRISAHRHSDHVDCFYVIEGEAEFAVGDEVVRAGPGAYVAAPVGVAHGFRNVGDGELRMLNIQAPNTGFARRMRDA